MSCSLNSSKKGKTCEIAYFLLTSARSMVQNSVGVLSLFGSGVVITSNTRTSCYTNDIGNSNTSHNNRGKSNSNNDRQLYRTGICFGVQDIASLILECKAPEASVNRCIRRGGGGGRG